MKFSKIFQALLSVALVMIMAQPLQLSAQSKTTYVGTNGTVYKGYQGSGEVGGQKCEETDEVYCYECRTFHTNKDYYYYDNGHCGGHHHCGEHHCDEHQTCGGHHSCSEHHGCDKPHCEMESTHCDNCKVYHADMYDMYHDYDHYGGGDYMVKYRGNKVKVKCASCGAKWKHYYCDYNSNHHYVYDRNDKVIVTYED